MMKIARYIIISVLLLGSQRAYAGNVAIDGIATASSEYYDPITGIYKTASLAIDGDPLTNWSADGISYGWLKIELNNSYLISTIVLKSLHLPVYYGHTMDYNLYSSLDDIDWDLIGSGTIIDTPQDWFDMWHVNGKNMRYIKYEVIPNHNPTAHWAHLYEIEVYPVPEPSTCFLFGFSLLGAGLIKRRASTCRSSKV